MILQRLYTDAPEIMRQTGNEHLPPVMYDLRPVRWVVDLDRNGNWINIRGQSGEGKKGARGLPRLLPNLVRTSAVQPILLADKPSYVLGIRPVDPKAPRDPARDRARTALEHEAFKQMVSECAEETGDDAVAAVAKFLAAWNPDAPPALPAELTKDDIIAFEVDDDQPLDHAAVQAFWAQRVRPTADPKEPVMQCLVSGLMGPVDKSSSVMIKGIPGGQSSGTALVSANARAFESYGLERSQTSPICAAAGEQYAKALNALLASSSHHLVVGGVVYVFWAPKGVVPLLELLGPQADPQEVRRLIDSYRTGKPWTGYDESPFHCVAFSASGGRAVVRSAIDTTIANVRNHLGEWFELLSMVDVSGEEGPPLGLFRLAVAPFREAKDIIPDVPPALAEGALRGTPLPQSLLHLLVLRCQAEGKVTYPRAALMKAILIQVHDMSPEEGKRMEQEYPQAKPAAYHCGRLLAELESIQRDAIPNLNATITDRFFGSASSAPASVFGTLLSGAQAHLGKLRRDREGAYHGHQARLEEILSRIDEFPRTLKLQDQALFSLGYYHHRAERRRVAADRAEEKKRAAGAGPSRVIMPLPEADDVESTTDTKEETK